MSVRDEGTGRRHVAAGETRETAAAVFGRSVPDLFATTYDALAEEVDLAEVRLLALADGPRQSDALAGALAGDAGELLVEVGTDEVRRTALAAALEGAPDWEISDVDRTDGHAVLRLVRGQEAGRLGPLLAALAAGPVESPAPQVWPEPRVPAAGSAPRPQQPREPAPPRPPARGPVLVRPRLGRRSLAILGAAGAVAVAALVLIGRSDLGSAGVLVAIGVGVLVLQLLVLAGLASIASSVGDLRSRADDDKAFHASSSRAQAELIKRQIALRDRVARQAQRLLEVNKSVLAIKREARSTTRYVEELAQQVATSRVEARATSSSHHLNTQRQVQALLNLQQLVDVSAAVPPTREWAGSADFLLLCVDTLLVQRPAVVVECGSGVSTLFLALAIHQHGLDTRLVTFEHDASYAEATRALLERHGVPDSAEVRLAPLGPSGLADHETPWYDVAALAGVADVGLLLVGGPPADLGSRARYPAVPLLLDRLSERCTVIIDDLTRRSEHETADAWAALLPDFELRVVSELDKPVGVLTRG